MLSVNNIYKSFQGKHILKNISFEQRKGSIGIILGASGSGKSTLLRILNNLESLDKGEILLDGIKICPNTIHTQQVISMVFQGFQSFNNLNVLDNIALGLKYSLKKSKKTSDAIAADLLQKYHLTEQAKLFPAQLSGGQKQRLAIARTIAVQPKIICMDEPSSALDNKLRAELIEHIHQLKNEGYIILISSHDNALIDNLEATNYQLKDGELTC